MPDKLTPEQRSYCMSRVKSKDTSLEKIVRSALFKQGYRFRKHLKHLPGTPDIAFITKKVAVFIDGDFWHGYNYKTWRHTLNDFWRSKIERNMARDKKNFKTLRMSGWTVIRIWEHEIKTDLQQALNKVIKALS